MSSAAKAAAQGPSKLSKILAHLNASPRLNLTGVKSLKLSYAYRNDHFGARHFAKEQLPRIRWANPELDIQVEKVLKAKNEQWRPELIIERENGASQTINMANKWSSQIVQELMDISGGAQWAEWKAEAAATGRSLVPGEQPPPKDKGPSFAEAGASNFPSLAQFRATTGNKAAPPPPADSAAAAAAQPSAST